MNDVKESLQDTYAPNLMCFGCGPQNRQGLQLKSFIRDEVLVAEFQPQPHHQAFDGILNGGIIGALLDCHCNWMGSWSLMRANDGEKPPACVTAEYSIKLHAITPLDQQLQITARSETARNRRAVVTGEITCDGKVTAECRGIFIAVKPGHPAYHRW